MNALDYKKAYKALYQPGDEPSLIDVPEIAYLMIDGAGDPNAEGGEYGRALELLYAVTYTIKMSKMGANVPAGYFEYVVPPLEGLWTMADGTAPVGAIDKSLFRWTSMIRQPDFVTADTLRWARAEALRKKGLSGDIRLEHMTEGLCVQCMHHGAFDDEPATMERIKRYIAQNGLVEDHTDVRRHHEIYLSDPRKTEETRKRTVLRVPVRRA